jgi:hypothetical protein
MPGCTMRGAWPIETQPESAVRNQLNWPIMKSTKALTFGDRWRLEG